MATAVALHVVCCNFRWRVREKDKGGKRTPTPAMVSGLTDDLCDVTWLFGEWMGQGGQDELIRKMDWLIAAMQQKP
ncbi:MAG: hypothetical protein DWQ34_07790 [Planctomycetota bacterium]|nr:MAG: hypothetical protein DWQ34_07790 [Planctomycetota bacterium]